MNLSQLMKIITKALRSHASSNIKVSVNLADFKIAVRQKFCNNLCIVIYLLIDKATLETLQVDLKQPSDLSVELTFEQCRNIISNLRKQICDIDIPSFSYNEDSYKQLALAFTNAFDQVEVKLK